MEELNNLIKENEKLNARLSNAVNVFHEQKSTIERLTEERDSSKFELEKREKYIKEQRDELENAKQMFQSLLHHAFTGELTRHKFGGDANG